MKLYRIKRLSDGKSFVANSQWPPNLRITTNGQYFTEGGVFFRQQKTIQKHLYNLCCDWERTPEHLRGPYMTKSAGPFWDRLDLYEVDILVVLDSETIKQPAKDFMGILEDA